MDNKNESRLLAKITDLEEALKDVLEIIDGDLMKSTIQIAYIHGHRVDADQAIQNGKKIKYAYSLLGMKRPT